MEARDLLFFDKMIMPKIITVIYWIALVVVVVSGLFTMSRSFLSGLGIIIGGLLAVRLYCELFVVLFKINESLQVIRDK